MNTSQSVTRDTAFQAQNEYSYKMSNTAKLIYFDGRGRGEMIRMVLCATGVEFTEEYLRKREDMEKLLATGNLTFEQVPYLEIDGLKLVQTGSIIRYLARRANIYGSNNEESTQIDIYFEGSRDFLMPFLPMGFLDKDEVLRGAKKKSVDRYLPIYNELLKKSKTGYLVGGSLTLADLGLLEPLLMCTEYFGTDFLNDYPELKKFYDNVTSLPNVHAFLNGPHRKRPNDDLYIQEVKTSLCMP